MCPSVASARLRKSMGVVVIKSPRRYGNGTHVMVIAIFSQLRSGLDCHVVRASRMVLSIEKGFVAAEDTDQ